MTDIFHKIQRYSEKLDNITLLTNQHWVSIDNILTNKTVYIFRTNNELIVSTNGKVEKERWEYIGNKSLLIDNKKESYLFKHGFFDENILALKVDSSEEYAVFVNENNYDGELNSIDKVLDFLNRKYLDPLIKSRIENNTGQVINPSKYNKEIKFIKYKTDKGTIELEPFNTIKGTKAFLNQQPAKDGIYKIGFINHFEVENGIIINNGMTDKQKLMVLLTVSLFIVLLWLS